MSLEGIFWTYALFAAIAMPISLVAMAWFYRHGLENVEIDLQRAMGYLHDYRSKYEETRTVAIHYRDELARANAELTYLRVLLKQKAAPESPSGAVEVEQERNDNNNPI